MRRAYLAGFGLLLLTLTGCVQKMWEQPAYRPLAQSHFFANRSSARLPVPDTVARGHVTAADPAFYTGMVNGKPIVSLPVKLDLALLKEGQRQYDIDCAPCHDDVGSAEGMIVQRGFPHPPSLLSADLRHDPDGHYFQVITHGYGVMFSYAARVTPRERWAIIAYIRALQLAAQASLSEVPRAARAQLEGER